MISFLRKTLPFVRPYKGRLILGIIFGLLGGLTNPLLMVAVKIAMQVVFPGEGDPLLQIHSQRLSATNATPAFTINADAPRLRLALAPGSEAITNWPGANITGSNELTLSLSDGSNAVTSRFIVATNEETEEKPLSTFSMSTAKWSQAFNTRLREIALSRNLKLIALIVMTIPLAMLLRGLFSYLNTYFMMWVSLRATADMRTKLFGHLVRQSVGFFHTVNTGELMSVTNRVPALQGIMGEALATIIIQPVTVIGLLVLLLTQHRELTLVSLFIFPVCVGAAVYFGKKARQSVSRGTLSSVSLNQQMHEAFTATRIVKAYNLERPITERFIETSRQVVSSTMRVVRAQELPGPLVEFMGAFGVSVFFLYIASKTGTKTSAAVFTQFVGSVFLMYAPIKSIVRLHSQIEQGRALSERIFEFLDTENPIKEPANPVPLKATGADIQFDNIDFSYGEKQALKDIQLTVKSGQLVALVGHSGSGKSTLTKLLLRFYDPQKGTVRIGGVDIRTASTADLRDQIAVVTQDVVLFNETIRRNIELGRPGATNEEIIRAAKHANAHEFIMENPAGYDFVIGEKGSILSGGQQQRIAIARAILRNAPILILDEATSALDNESQRAVKAALDKLMEGRTTICIAHRLTTIHHADVIIVMKDGMIAETGTHDELMKRQGIYHNLYKLQFAD